LYCCAMNKNYLQKKVKMKLNIWLIIIFTGLAAAMSDPVTLTLEDCLSIAKQQSPSALIASQELEAGEWKYKNYRSTLSPQVSLSGTAPRYSRSIEQVLIDSTTGYLTRNYSSSNLNLSINQNIPHTGGSFYITSRLNRYDEYSPEHTYSWMASPLEIGIVQPIFQYNPFRWSRKIEPVRYELAKKQFLVNMEEVSLEVCRRFFDLYIASMELTNAQFNVAVNDTIFAISKGRFQVGKIAENDLLRSELAVMNSQTALEQARLDLDQAQQNLKISLGMNNPDSIIILVNQEIDYLMIGFDQLLQLTRDNNIISTK